MRSFAFLVMGANGSRREITIEAEDDADARRRLKRQGLIPVRPLNLRRSPALRRGKRGKFDVNAFTDRLAPLLEANVPLEKALAVMEEGSEDSKMLEVIFKLRKGLHEGRRFSEMIREMEPDFPPIYSSLIETGEEAGCLPEVAVELRRFLRESKDFRDFVVTSSIYPVIVVSMTLLVAILLFVVFIPKFAKVFTDMGNDIPTLTAWMLAISRVMVAYWWVLLLLIPLGMIYRARVRREGRLRRWRDRIVLKLPLVGPLVVSIQIGHFIRALSIMVRNHVHLLPAVRISRRAISNTTVRASFEAVEGDLRGGGKLSRVLSASPYMPSGSNAMLKIAEESGEVGEMLERIATEQELTTRSRVKRLLAALEPIIIVVLAMVVMLVVLAVFMSIWKMNSIR